MEGHPQLLLGAPLHPTVSFPPSMLAYACLNSTKSLGLTT